MNRKVRNLITVLAMVILSAFASVWLSRYTNTPNLGWFYAPFIFVATYSAIFIMPEYLWRRRYRKNLERRIAEINRSRQQP